MLSRRDFIIATIAAIPGSWGDQKVEDDTRIRADKYSEETILAMLVIGRDEFLRDLKKLRDYNLEISLVKDSLPYITVRCNAEYYKDFGPYDASPDPGHINYHRIHQVKHLVTRFDRRFRDLKINNKDLKDYKIFIRIRKI